MAKKKEMEETEIVEPISKTKEKYFFPDFGEIEAESMEEAQKIFLDSKK